MNLINKTAVQGSNNIIQYSPASCKILFPSTHVVFEGFKETKFNISEDEDVKPILIYSSGKILYG